MHLTTRLRWLCSVLFMVMVFGSNAWALDGSWTGVPAVPGRINHSMVFDPVANRLVLFGGSDGFQKLNDAWQLNLASPFWTWTKILQSSSPPGRVGHTAIYDAVGGRMIVFGGVVGSQTVSEVWSLPLVPFVGAWQQLTTTGTVQTLGWHTAVYDSQRRRMIVYGGETNGVVTNHIYALDLATLAWQELFPAPARLRYHAAAYDAQADQMYVFGGEETVGSSMALVSKTFRFNLATQTWTQLTPASAPTPVEFHEAAFDPSRRELVVCGGTTSPAAPGANGPPASSSVYRLPVDNPTQWNPVVNLTVSPKRQEFASAFDPGAGRMLIFGGSEGPQSPNVGLIARTDTWSLSLGANPSWSAIHVRPHAGSWFAGHSMVQDLTNQRIFLYGGTTLTSGATNGLFQISNGDPDKWVIPTVSGSPPPARYDHTAIYEYPTERMIVFGGFNGGLFQDVWALNMSGGTLSWSQLSPSGTGPGPRAGHTAVHANQIWSNRRMIVFGGYDGTSLRNDVWALKLSGPLQWEAVATTGHVPTARQGHTAVYDYPNNRMIVYGGTRSDGSISDELFSLNFITNVWTKVTVTGPKPPARSNHVAVISPNSDNRMTIMGGRGANGLLRDAWVLPPDLSRWTQISFPAGPAAAEREEHAAAYLGYGMIAVAGGLWDGFAAQSLETFNDTWILNLDPAAPLRVVTREPGSTRPNGGPALGGSPIVVAAKNASFVTFQLAGRSAQGARFAIYDVAGRLRRRLNSAASSGPGVTWDYRDADGARVPSGVYFVRAEGGEGVVSSKFMVLR